MKELFRGAEAVIYEDKDILVKDRVSKSYRIKEIDEPLRRIRTKNEVSLLRKALSAGISVPKIIKADKYSFKMEDIKGQLLRDYINECRDLQGLFKKVSYQINLMHEAGIVHADLTTSNMILKDEKIYFIDFSLGGLSTKVEDKAVDLHLIKQALIAKHNKVWKKCFEVIINNYKDKRVIERLKAVEKRGRKK